jgi:hypothetical protein
MLPNLVTNVRKTLFVYNCAWVRFKFQKRLSQNYRGAATCRWFRSECCHLAPTTLNIQPTASGLPLISNLVVYLYLLMGS